MTNSLSLNEIKVFTKILPKTGTKITFIRDRKNLIAKKIILGNRNSISHNINSIFATYGYKNSIVAFIKYSQKGNYKNYFKNIFELKNNFKHIFA